MKNLTNLTNRRAGLLFGSLTADALSLGVHWVYNTTELSQKFGYVDSFHAPGTESYHPKKQAGEQSHVGDQALSLVNTLSRDKHWNPKVFMADWIAMWNGYPDYFDHATKSALENVTNGNSITDCASESTELAGPARIAPLVAFLGEQDEETVVQAALEQTALTHRSSAASATTEFLARASYRLLHGANLEEVIRSLAPPEALIRAEAQLSKNAVAAIQALGQSCSIDGAIPGVLYLVLKHGDDLPKAFSENAMAGGDNCARGLALGMLLGAAHGIDAIPLEWRDQLSAKENLNALL